MRKRLVRRYSMCDVFLGIFFLKKKKKKTIFMGGNGRGGGGYFIIIKKNNLGQTFEICVRGTSPA